VADDLDRTLGGAADRGLVDVRHPAATARLAYDARMHHAIELYVVDENRRAEDFVREVDAGRVLADNAVLVCRLDGEAGGCRSRQVDAIGERPVILTGRFAIAANCAVRDGEVCRGAVQARRSGREKQCANLRAGETHRDAAELNRLTAGRVALVRSERGVAGLQVDAAWGNVEFVGCDLRHRRQNTLTDLDPSCGYGDTPRD
jgi:hypothetical protein